jgi:hypothetical protein
LQSFYGGWSDEAGATDKKNFHGAAPFPAHRTSFTK